MGDNNGMSISVPLEKIIEIIKVQRNQAIDDNVMLRVHIDELYLKIAELENKDNEEIDVQG